MKKRIMERRLNERKMNNTLIDELSRKIVDYNFETTDTYKSSEFFDFMEKKIVPEILKKVKENMSEDEIRDIIWDVMNDRLIYTDYQWELAKNYQFVDIYKMDMYRDSVDDFADDFIDTLKDEEIIK